MKSLIVYATNSGGTRFASEHIQSFLIEQGHDASMQEAWEVDFDTLSNYDFVLFGTNTWFYNDKEGQPHKWYLDRQAEIEGKELSSLRCGIFALGDSSYAQFCHSAEILTDLIGKTKAQILDPILKIDGYYRDEKNSGHILDQWLNQLLSSLQVA